MVWNSVWPNGTKSVKGNENPGLQNTQYIETTLGNAVVGTNNANTTDHFFDVSANLDGHHRFVKMPKFTVGGNAADPALSASMDGVIYLKTTSGTVQGFYKNAQGVYQFIPALLTGVVNDVNSTYKPMVSVPENTYGEIFMYTGPVGTATTAIGFYRSDTVCNAYAIRHTGTTASSISALRFGNGTNAGAGADILKIMVRTEDAASGLNWNFKVTYRSI